MSNQAPHYIVAIGASAGGLEEINAFFDHTPLDGICYVIVQHLSPTVKSWMAELVSKHSKLSVIEAQDDMLMQRNIVYTIPNDKFMTVKNGSLFLTEKPKGKAPNLTVNAFFNSLASSDMGKKSIGVILSGLGSDGAEGITAIKEAGGMVIARNPVNSKFSGMPDSSIATGMVDYILEPSQMPEVIEDYVTYGKPILPDVKSDEKNLIAIVDLIKQTLPFDFGEYKQTTILRRIKRRSTENNFTKLEDYLEFLKVTPKEVEDLAKDFLISVTSFFRDAEAFKFLKENVLPVILKDVAKGEELKMWVAGCATGEEAYSLAILIAELVNGNAGDIVVKIFATDISQAAITTAGKGIYEEDIEKAVSAERLEKYFTKEETNYKIKPEIRNMVIFAQHDMVKNPPYCNMHFISCRNVLIYMAPVLQQKIFNMLLFGLKMNGYLFLGPSENPASIIENLEEINKIWKIYKNLEAKRVVSFESFAIPVASAKGNRVAVTMAPEEPYTNLSLAEAITSAVIQEQNSVAVCIDKECNVVKHYGDTSRFLLQQNFKFDLEGLLPKPLEVAFKTLNTKVQVKKERAAIKDIKIKKGAEAILVTLTIIPLDLSNGKRGMQLVVFTEQHADDATANRHADENMHIDDYTKSLEVEAIQLKEKLKTAQVIIAASSENIQSFNEELISANEEMQSTNEEMQSVNEELHTINSDYQHKNKELLELNDDLNNYFRSNINGQLFVNDDLILMKFSPGTVKQINLLPTDVGRPLSNISTNIKLETLTEDIKKVLAEGCVLTREVETNNGKFYQVMTMPYIQQQDNKSNGAIITFNDITDLKTAQVALNKTNLSLQRINADLDNFVYIATHDLLSPLSNIEFSIHNMNEIKVSDPEFKEYLGVINSSVKKFRSLINDIAAISKIEADMKDMEMLDIDETLDNVEWALGNKIKSANATLNRNLEIEQIRFSKKNLRSILFNLVSNAIKFKGKEDPIVSITTIAEDGNIVLSVEDNGIGIEKEELGRIFDLYGRLHHEVEGQGIGLYLAKKIITAAGGTLTVESEPGKGSRFSITLGMV